MTRQFRHVLALFVMLASTSALAGETWARARAKINSCGYFHNAEAEVSLSYRNYDLPWGTSVYLIYGWGGNSGYYSPPFDWVDQQTIEVPATAPYTWGTVLTRVVRERSSTVFEHIDFVWRVVLPNGHEFYEKGNGSTWGFYLADFSEVEMPCTSTGNYVTSPQPIPITTVERW